MGSQVFRMIPDYHKVFSVLDEVCVNSEKYFVIKDTTYRQLLYCEKIEKFYDYLYPYYHVSKNFYLELERGYSGFLSVLRQLCKVFDIPFVSKVVYQHGSYINTMTIYVNRNDWETQPTEPLTVVLQRPKQNKNTNKKTIRNKKTTSQTCVDEEC